MAVEAGLSVYVVGGQGVRLFVVVVSCGVLDVFLLGGFLSRHVCDLCDLFNRRNLIFQPIAILEKKYSFICTNAYSNFSLNNVLG